MWKKEDAPDAVPTLRPEPAPVYERAAPPTKVSTERATIGRSISINGQVSGDEDLLIQGRVDGSVNLKQHAVTVGPEGEIKADITARIITIEGRVEGNLHAQDQVILRGSAVVEGNITAPRVVLEDGARFRGGVDMGETPKPNARVNAAEAGRPAGSHKAPEPEPVAKPGDGKSTAAAAKDVAALTATR